MTDQPELFEVDPPALIYRGFRVRPHDQRCRECHQPHSYRGGGLIGPRSDETGGGGYQYAVCARCFNARGRRGQLARRGGVRGRQVVEATDE